MKLVKKKKNPRMTRVKMKIKAEKKEANGKMDSLF